MLYGDKSTAVSIHLPSESCMYVYYGDLHTMLIIGH